jgi:highly repetitive protein
MNAFKTLKIPAALLLTAGLVSATLSVAKADEQPDIKITTSQTKKKDRIFAKADYLPDALGRVGYAIFMADQQQPENIHNYERPRTQWVYESDTLSVRNHQSFDDGYYGMVPFDMGVDTPLDKANESVDLGIKDDTPKVSDVDIPEVPNSSDVPIVSDIDTPEVPEVPTLPNTPDLPEPPTVSNIDIPEAPIAPGTSDLPEPPTVSDIDIPELPDTPTLPDLPESPDVPEFPNTPGLPDLPDLPELPDTPDLPELPNTPELPDLPELPAIPDVPVVPNTPDVPDVPALPDVPGLPELPDVPDTPVVPDVPAQPDFSNPSTSQSSGAPLHINSNNVMDKEYREEVVTIKQGQTTKYDLHLKQGETRFVAGNPGQIVKTYEDTYYNGTFSYSTLLEEKTTVEPISDILYVGSEVKDSNLSVVDLKIGDTLDHCTITGLEGDIKGYVNASYYDLLSESEDTRFKKAVSSIDASYSTLDPREEEPFNHGYRWLGASDDVVTLFNSGSFVDKHKINEYLLNYINADREERGLNKLVIDPELQSLVDTRAQEMASYGHIHYQGKPHTRPDGTSWSTVLEQLPTTYKSYGFVENMLAYSVLSNPYQLVSEHWIAKRLFEQWKSSGPHYAAMMDPKATRTAVSVKLTTRTNARSENGTNWMVGSQLFSK